MYPYIQIGDNITLSTFNLCIGVAVLVALLVFEKNEFYLSASNKYQTFFRLLFFCVIIFGFLGAFLLDGLTKKTYSLEQTGFTVVGGIITSIFILLIASKFGKLGVEALFNLFAPSFCIAHCIGRIGCFFAGCCYGKPSNFITSCYFKPGSIAFTEHGKTALHPTQLYESIFLFLLFIFLKKSKTNYNYLIYLFSYFSFRFFIEFLRDDNRGTLLNINAISSYQQVSLALCALSVIIIIFKLFKKETGIKQIRKI